MKNTAVTIIAGPCSLSTEIESQLFDIAQVTATHSGKTQRAIWGLRVVGLKSRTAIDHDGVGMGIDFNAYTRNIDRYIRGESSTQFEILPSALIAQKVVRETGLIAATEVVDPLIQLPSYERIIPHGKLLVWNPAVNQIGFSALAMGQFAARNGWYLGIKNGKWLGETPESGMTTMEKTWSGLLSYACGGNGLATPKKAIMIHRGVDVSEKGAFRNLPVHDAAARVKEKLSVQLFFDPSHTHGPELRHRIVDETVAALALTTKDGNFLYDGILIEVGDSPTDTGQHITIPELRELCNRIATFRDIQSPDPH